MMKLYVILLFMIVMSSQVFSVEDKKLTQTVKGRITCFQNAVAIKAAKVMLIESIENSKKMPAKHSVFTKEDGSFSIEKVPVGRYEIKISHVAYEPISSYILVSSGKELIFDAQMVESFHKTEAIIVESSTVKPINESAIVSASQFSIEDVSRYAGSLMDVSRAAQNFAGVISANDQRNDIIIRGGSPTELLWRIDGIDVENPNHFATQGATGGPISAINTLLLTRSDFLTGAFPAEYINKMSGVFDLHTRHGNYENREYMLQLGFNGFEAGYEGPIIKNKLSIIANYRYSFLGLLEKAGFSFGYEGVPEYQDGTIKIDYEPSTYDKISILTLFGKSQIEIKNSKSNSTYTGDEDAINGSKMFASVCNWQHIFNEKVFGKLTFGVTYSNYFSTVDSITADAQFQPICLTRWYEGNSSESAASIKYVLNIFAAQHHNINFGLEAKERFYDFNEQNFTVDWGDSVAYKLIKDGSSLQTSSFINWNWRITETLTSNLGVASQFYQANNKVTIEPRVSLSYKTSESGSINMGFGVHRQSLPLIMQQYSKQNEQLDFMQSIHYVLGYSQMLLEKIECKLEVYYKDISKAPIEIDSSSWSFLNTGANFGSVSTKDAVSMGTGKAYGAEFSVTKHFSEGYYFMSTLSYIRQKYKGSDGIERDGAFDNKFIFNFVGGFDWNISTASVIEFSTKFVYAGGLPYTPIDVERTILENSTCYLKSEAFSERNPDYWRLDFKVEYRTNFVGCSFISFFSVQNILNTKNVLKRKWDFQKGIEKVSKQMGFYPMGGIRFEF